MNDQKKMLAFLNGFSKGLQNTDRPCTLFIANGKGDVIDLHADSNKSNTDKFLDLLEERMKQHNEYWERIRSLFTDDEEK